MIVTPEKNGVSYRASKEKKLALFDNHELLIFDGNDIVFKATCPSINLDLGEMKKWVVEKYYVVCVDTNGKGIIHF